jgi:hypothetical protein
MSMFSLNPDALLDVLAMLVRKPRNIRWPECVNDAIVAHAVPIKGRSNPAESAMRSSFR